LVAGGRLKSRRRKISPAGQGKAPSRVGAGASEDCEVGRRGIDRKAELADPSMLGALRVYGEKNVPIGLKLAINSTSPAILRASEGRPNQAQPATNPRNEGREKMPKKKS